MERLVPVPPQGQEASGIVLFEAREQQAPESLEQHRKVLEPFPTGGFKDLMKLTPQAFDPIPESGRKVGLAWPDLVDQRVAQGLEPVRRDPRRWTPLPQAGTGAPFSKGVLAMEAQMPEQVRRQDPHHGIPGRGHPIP